MRDSGEEPIAAQQIAKPPPKAPAQAPPIEIPQYDDAPIQGAGESREDGGDLLSPTGGDEEDGPRVECESCGRLFLATRIEKHEQVCRKQRARKPFDAAAKRHDDLPPEEKKLVHKEETARTIDKTARVKANKLMWETDEPVEAFGQKNQRFKAVYDDGRGGQEAQAAQGDAQGSQQGRGSEGQAQGPQGSQNLQSQPPQNVHSSQSLQSSQPANPQPSQQSQSAPPPQQSTQQPPAPRQHRHKKHSSQSKQAQLLQLQQLLGSMQGPGAFYAQPMQGSIPSGAQFPAQQFQPQQYPSQQYQQPQYQQQQLPPPQMAPAQRFRFCVYCGTQYVEGAAFCGVCGAKRIE